MSYVKIKLFFGAESSNQVEGRIIMGVMRLDWYTPSRTTLLYRKIICIYFAYIVKYEWANKQ